MKPIIAFLAILITLVQSKIYSQTIHYTYDDSGNRIKREIILMSRNIQERTASENNSVTDKLSDKSIRIYPNPTKGLLKIEILNFEDIDKGNIYIFDLSGHQIFHTKINTSCSEIDLSSKSNGIYILQIQLNQENTTWKIIKE